MNKGFALISVILILGVLLLIGTAFFTLVSFENKISLSQESTFGTYYLAEAGINEVIYKLRNDSVWQDEFEDGTIDRGFTRTDDLVESGSYQVRIVSTDPGEADIVSIGRLDLHGSIAQRVVKTKVIKAVNPNPLADMTTYTDEDTNINLSFVTVETGSIFANDDLNLFAWSRADILNGQAMAADQINLRGTSTLNASGGCFATNCPSDCSSCNPAPDHVAMPMLDFDSDDENSYKSKAGAVYTEAEFKDLLDNNNPLVLDRDVTYVEGDVRIKRGHSLILSGILVADGNITFGEWAGSSHIEINHTPGKGSGLISKNSIEFMMQPWADDINIEGVLYAMDRVRIRDIAFIGNFSLTGAIVARELTFFDLWGNSTLNYDDDTLVKTLFGPPADAPVVTIEHWEEEY